MHDRYYRAVVRALVAIDPQLTGLVVISGQVGGRFALGSATASRDWECRYDRELFHYDMRATLDPDSGAWSVAAPKPEPVCVVLPRSVRYDMQRLPHFSRYFDSVLVVRVFDARICGAAHCKCKAITYRMWSVVACLDATLRPERLVVSETAKLLRNRLYPGDLDKVLASLPLNRESLRLFSWNTDFMRSIKHRMEFGSQHDTRALGNMASELGPALVSGARTDTLGLFCGIYGPHGLVYVTPELTVEQLERDIHSDCCSRVASLTQNHADLAVFAHMRAANRALVYPIAYQHEVFSENKRVAGFAAYVREMERFYRYYADACKRDSPFVQITDKQAIDSVSDGVHIFYENPSIWNTHMSLLIESGLHSDVMELRRALAEPRVHILATIHLPSQIRQVTLSNADCLFVCPNRALARWAASEISPMHACSFTSLMRNNIGDHEHARICILWAHMLGIQQWLALVRRFTKSELVFVGSYYGCHPGGSMVAIQGGRFRRELGYGLGNVYAQTLKQLSDKIVLVAAPKDSSAIGPAYMICKTVYDYENHHISWDTALETLSSLVPSDGSLQHHGEVFLQAGEPIKYTPCGPVFVVHDTGDHFAQELTNDHQNTVHVCVCHTRGPGECHPNVRYRIRSNSDLVTMDEVLLYYCTAEGQVDSERCVVSERPFISAATNTLIPLRFAEGETCSIRNYTGEPASSVRFATTVRTVPIMHLAQAATLTTGELAVRMAPSEPLPMEISPVYRGSWPTDNFFYYEQCHLV